MDRFRKIETEIEGLFIIEICSFSDACGMFFETYNEETFFHMGLEMRFVQDNESLSTQNVLRGLHVQKCFPQGKLVRVVQGCIFDVVVDLREESLTYGNWFGVELSDNNNKELYIPQGFAHGFYVMSDMAKVNFKVTDYWHPEDEIGIPWDDVSLNIDWNIPEGCSPIIADKDLHYMPFESNFKGIK